MPSIKLRRSSHRHTFVITLLAGFGVSWGVAHARLQPETAPPPAKPGLTHPAPDQPAAPAAPAAPAKPTTPDAPAPTPPKAPGGGMPDVAQIKAMMEEQSKPADEHKVLEALVGSFHAVGTLTFPSLPPIVSKGKATGTWILGNRFVKVETKIGEGDKDIKSEGLTIYGYDTQSHKYTVTGFDTFGTYSVSASGDYDQAAKELKLAGEVTEGGQKMKFRWNVKLADKAVTTQIQMELAPNSWITVSELAFTKP